MTPTTNKLRAAVIVALVPLLFSACASEAYKAQVKKEKEEKENYVWYTPVGSNIPIKVPKDQAKASAEETEKTTAIFRDIQRSTQQPETGPQSGIPGQPGGGGAK